MSVSAPRSRIYRLRPWFVRALLPKGLIGSYLLIRDEVRYVRRSDTDLRRRLVAHARSGVAEYFTYEVHPDPTRAYVAECAGYHALKGEAANLIHPAAPVGANTSCPFCPSAIALADAHRRLIETSSRRRQLCSSSQS